MHFNQIIFLIGTAIAGASAAVDAQYSDQYNNAASVHQDRHEHREHRHEEVKSKANEKGYYASDLPQSVQDNLAARSTSLQQFRASVSADAVAQGYSDISAIPTSVRQQFISSVYVAHSGDIHQMRESASAFMATQTKIDKSSLSQMIATATTGKPNKFKEFFHRKKKNATITGTLSGTFVPTATPTGLSNGFKNFFKSVQMKIQAGHSSSVVASAIESAVSSVSADNAAAATPTPIPTN